MVKGPRAYSPYIARTAVKRRSEQKVRRARKDVTSSAWKCAVRAANGIWKGCVTVVLGVVTIGSVVFIIHIIYKAVMEPAIAIAPISVPKDLAENGYTHEVVAERLQAALKKLGKDAQQSKIGDVRGRKGLSSSVDELELDTAVNGFHIAQQAHLPNIVVPNTGLSIETIADSIRGFLDSGDHRDAPEQGGLAAKFSRKFGFVNRRSNVTGELTKVKDNLLFRIQIDEQDLDGESIRYDSGKGLDELFRQGAERVLEKIDPITLALALADHAPARSLEIVKKVVEERPRTTSGELKRARLLSGAILLDRSETDEAIRQFRKAVEIDETDALPHLWMGVALDKQGNQNEAIKEFDKAVSLDSTDLRCHTWRAHALSRQGKFEEAIVEYNKAILLQPESSLPHEGLGDTLRIQGKLERAIDEYQKAIELDPKNSASHIGLGLTLRAQFKHSDAAAKFRTAIELDPTDWWPHYNLALVLRGEEAIAEFGKAIEFAPKRAYPHFNLAIELRRLGRQDEATKEIKKAIELEPERAVFHNELGTLFDVRRNVQEAVTELRKAIELDSEFAWPHNNLAMVLARQGRTDEAIVELNRAIELAPRDAEAHNSLGELLVSQQKLNEGVTEFRKAMEFDPKFGKPHNNLAMVLVSEGKADEAFVELNRAIELDSKNGLYHINLAKLLLDQHKTDAAYAEYKKAVELDPKNLSVYRGLMRAARLNRNGANRRRERKVRRTEVDILLQEYGLKRINLLGVDGELGALPINRTFAPIYGTVA